MDKSQPVPMVLPVAGPGPGAPEVVPPPSVPLGFLLAGGIGLIGFGLAVWLAADRIVVTPTHSGVIAAVHVGVLAFLTTAVLGAVHQFVPVVARRRLRSVRAARLTLVGMVLTAWILPTGFEHGPEALVATGGVIGAFTVALAVWNLSGPLSSPDGGTPLWGLRLSVGYLAITVAFGVVYAFDRQTGWFPLLPHRVLAHAHLGLLGWLGLTYVAVAEKLWPMFLLAHRPSARSGTVAVSATAVGVAVLAPGLLFDVPTLAWAGGLTVGVGLLAHLVSLASCVRRRRRPLELLHAFLFTSAAFLVVALVLATLAGAASVSGPTRSRLIAAEVASLTAWLGLAVVGHAHKIVPFIGYSALRGRGIRKTGDGKPLMFSHLYSRGPARAALVLAGGGFAAVVVGILSATGTLVAVGGAALAACGATATINLASGPRRVIKAQPPTIASAAAPVAAAEPPLVTTRRVP